MDNCLFCKIIKGEIPSENVYEDEKVLGFKDLYPQAKEHYLFIHKDHTANVNDLTESSPEQLKDLFGGIQKFTSSCELAKNGFRVVTNHGKHGGQTVFHTHFHVLGGEQLGAFGN